MRVPSTRRSIGLVLALVALAAAAASIAAVGAQSTAAAPRLEAAACAGVSIPTAPARSSIALFSKGEPEATALEGSGNPALMRAGSALRRALRQSDNAIPVIRALTDAAKECRSLGLHIARGS